MEKRNFPPPAGFKPPMVAPIARAVAFGAALLAVGNAAAQVPQAPQSLGRGPQNADQSGAPAPAARIVKTPDCALSLPALPPAKLFVPPERATLPKHARHRNKPAVSEGRFILTDDPTPVLEAETASCTELAAQDYRQIAAEGGWPMLRQPLGPDAAPDDIARLRQRLVGEGDLSQSDADAGGGWDAALRAALMRFQLRVGLKPSGEVDESTLKELDVPAQMRAGELAASARRIEDVELRFDAPFVVVNIPSASVEAVQNGRVVERHAAIAGKIDWPSPELTAPIRSITLNPTWTIPRSIVEREVIPRLRRDPRYLRRARLIVLDHRGHRVDLRHFRKSSAARFTFRQLPGAKNALGRLRLNMPNHYAVYMHDTPEKSLFGESYRFLSHGCVRVYDIYELAAWLLDVAGSSRHWEAHDLIVAAQEGKQREIALAAPVPVAWVYLDGWESADGRVHFAPDVYHLDGNESEGRAQVNGGTGPD